jgi:hypothetical protein
MGVDSSFELDEGPYEWSYAKAAALSRSGATVRGCGLGEGRSCMWTDSTGHRSGAHRGYSALTPLGKARSDPSWENTDISRVHDPSEDRGDVWAEFQGRGE